MPLLKRNPELELVIAGKADEADYLRVMEKTAELLGAKERFHFVGQVSDEDKAWYMKNCEAFMFPSIAEGFGATCDVLIDVGYPFLKNDETLTNRAFELAKAYLGSENVEEMPARMTAEDFSYYSQVVPSCFYRLGTGNTAKGITSPVHTPTFDVDENCLKIGAGLMAWIAVNGVELHR